MVVDGKSKSQQEKTRACNFELFIESNARLHEHCTKLIVCVAGWSFFSNEVYSLFRSHAAPQILHICTVAPHKTCTRVHKLHIF